MSDGVELRHSVAYDPRAARAFGRFVCMLGRVSLCLLCMSLKCVLVHCLCGSASLRL